MADTQLYGTLCTSIGNAAIANSVVTGTKINFAQIVVGDGGGTPYVPTSGMTALKRQVWSGAIAEVTQDPQQANRMILHAVLPSSVGGWVMREIGVQDDKGRLIAIGNTPEIPKEVVTSGAIMEMDLYIYVSVVDARGVNVVIDPTVVIASKADLAKVQKALDDFKKLAVTGIKLGNNTALAMSGNVVTIPTADGTHDGYMSKEQATQLAGTVPNTRKINNHTLTSDLSLTASDVGARPSTWTPTYNDVGAPSLSSHNSLVSQITSLQASLAQVQTNVSGMWKTVVVAAKPPSLSSNTIYCIVNDSGCLAQLALVDGKVTQLMSYSVSDIDHLAVCLVKNSYNYIVVNSYPSQSTFVGGEMESKPYPSGITYSGIGSASFSIYAVKASGTYQGDAFTGIQHSAGLTFELVTKTGIHIPIEKQRYNYNGWMDNLYTLIQGITSLNITVSPSLSSNCMYADSFLNMGTNSLNARTVDVTKIPYNTGTYTYVQLYPTTSSSSSVSFTQSFSCSINGKSIPCKIEDHIS